MSLKIETQQGLRVLTMTAGKANAMNPDFFQEFLERLDELEREPLPLVLTAEGGIFCAGLDLIALGAMDRPALESFFQSMDAALLRLLRYPAPTLAAVNGHAIAGGAVLALCCDRRVLATGKSKFGLSEVAVGVSFPGVPFEIVRAALPAAVAREVLQFGTLFDPETALKLGLVDELCAPEELRDRAAELATRLPADSLAAYAIVKAQVNRPILANLERNKAEDDRRFFDNWFGAACQRRMQAAIANFKSG